jgi:predicted acetyltransferase
MATTTAHKEQDMDTYELVKTTTADAIRIADMIAEYREARTEHRKAWERADEAFAKYMKGESKNGGAARRLDQVAENASSRWQDATYQLTLVGIDADLIDKHDNTNRTPHYDAVS